MKIVRNMAQMTKAMAAQMQNRRVVLLVLGFIIASLVVACSSASMPSTQSSNPPATNQESAVAQAQELATEESQAQESASGQSQAQEPATEEGDDEDTAADEEGDDEDAAADEEGDDEDSPDEEGQENLSGMEEFGMTSEELVKNIEAVESKIATCMADAGFEYVPVDYATVRKAMDADKASHGLSSEEYAATYGYGISTQPPDDAGSPAMIGLGEENLRIFNSLSEADQEAYNHTLFGENTDATFAVTLEDEDFSETGGCTRTAIEQVFSPEQLSESFYNPGDARVEQDPRVVAAIKAWSDCMRQAGFDYNTPEDTEPDIEDRLEAILDGADPEDLSAPAQAALTELQSEERAIALADFQCETTLVEPVKQQVESELYGAPQQ